MEIMFYSLFPYGFPSIRGALLQAASRCDRGACGKIDDENQTEMRALPADSAFPEQG